MAGQKGRDVLIKIGDGGGTEVFTTVAGIRAKTISLNARAVDGTSGESPSAWRELIAGAGVKSASVSGAGVFKDAASDATIQSTVLRPDGAQFPTRDPRLWHLAGPVPDRGAGLCRRPRRRSGVRDHAGLGRRDQLHGDSEPCMTPHNRARGEVLLEIDGRMRAALRHAWRLAELEAAFDVPSFSELGERLGAAHAHPILIIVIAALTAGGRRDR